MKDVQSKIDATTIWNVIIKNNIIELIGRQRKHSNTNATLLQHTHVKRYNTIVAYSNRYSYATRLTGMLLFQMHEFKCNPVYYSHQTLQQLPASSTSL